MKSEAKRVNKIATYLNEHIQGEVLTSEGALAQYATDASVLSITPDMVVHPRTTNDIRKITRFASQLSEKGHTVGVTVRGGGADITGASVGEGIVVDVSKYLHNVFELDTKQKRVRLQPGVRFGAMNDGLKFHSLSVPTALSSVHDETVGGAISNNSRGDYSGKYGSTGEYVERLEVILSTGDVLQTGRISKRELNRKKGLQTFEGEIYRSIDGLLTDHRAVLDAMDESMNQAGYPGIARVQNKDGSVDLTPLFIGAQGTLGVISEVILKTEFLAPKKSAVLLLFQSIEDARDAIDDVLIARPAAAEMYSGAVLKQAYAQGKKFDWLSAELLKSGAALLVEVDDLNDRVRAKRLKKLIRKLQTRQFKMMVIEEAEGMIGSLGDIRSVLSLVQHPTEAHMTAPPIANDVMVPVGRFEEFTKGLATLSKKYAREMPLHCRVLDSLCSVYPQFDFTKVTERQKMFAFIEEFTALVYKLGGTNYAGAPEGRLFAPHARNELNEKVRDVYREIKTIFDPHGILNPGVKSDVDVKTVIKQLNTRYQPRI